MKRRVLIDSDSENDEHEEGKPSVPEQTSKSQSNKSGMEASSPAHLEVMPSPKKSPVSSLAVKSPLKTPPKRATGKPAPPDQDPVRNMTCW